MKMMSDLNSISFMFVKGENLMTSINFHAIIFGIYKILVLIFLFANKCQCLYIFLKVHINGSIEYYVKDVGKFLFQIMQT